MISMDITKTYVCDFCGNKVVREFHLPTPDARVPKISKMDIPIGWVIDSNGKLICNNIHVELE